MREAKRQRQQRNKKISAAIQRQRIVKIKQRKCEWQACTRERAWSNTVRCMGRRASNVDFLFLLLSSSLGCYGAQTHIVNERVLCRTNFTSNNFGINELPSRRSDLNILCRMSLSMVHAIASWMAKQSDTQTKYYYCRQVMIIIRMSGARATAAAAAALGYDKSTVTNWKFWYAISVHLVMMREWRWKVEWMANAHTITGKPRIYSSVLVSTDAHEEFE